ncbi:MAG: hypothetical protein WCX48_02650 [Bacteroidales bacterium]
MGRSTSVIDIEVLETLVSTQSASLIRFGLFLCLQWVSAGKTFVCNVSSVSIA